MCTEEQVYDQATNAIEHVIFNSEDGPSRFEKEMRKIFFQAVGKWLLTGGVLVIVVVANLYFQVSQHEKQLNEGDRYTQEEHDTYSRNHERLHDLLWGELAEMKQDIKDIRNAVIGH